MRVLLVEDDLAAAHGIAAVLKAAGIVADMVATGTEAVEITKLYDYDLMLLDLILPDMEGHDVLRQLRAARHHVPVLILSGQSGTDTRVKGLDLGADDFVTKPYDASELVARIQAVVRRTKGFSHSKLSVGHVSLDLGAGEVTVHGVPVRLTAKEYAILEILTLRQGTVMTKEAFLNHLYGGVDEPEVKIIDVFICKLRKKLADAGARGVITTVWGRGYVLRDPAAGNAASPRLGSPSLPAARAA